MKDELTEAHAALCGKPPGSFVQVWGDLAYWVLPGGREEPLKRGEDPRGLRLARAATVPG